MIKLSWIIGRLEAKRKWMISAGYFAFSVYDEITSMKEILKYKPTDAKRYVFIACYPERGLYAADEIDAFEKACVLRLKNENNGLACATVTF